MSIQSNINETLSLAGYFFSKTPRAKHVKEAREYQGRQEQAIRGLADIEKNLKRENVSHRIGPPTLEEFTNPEFTNRKSYNLEELENIDSRVKQYQKDIYDAKSAALNPNYKGLIKNDEIKQPELSSQLTRIREMSSRAKEALAARKKEANASTNFTKLMNGEPVEDMFGVDYNEPTFPVEDQRGPDEKISHIEDENDPFYVHTLADKRKRAEEELQRIYDNYETLREDLENNYYAWHNGREPSSKEVAEGASRREASNILGKLPLTADQFLGLSYEDDGTDGDIVKKIKETEFDNTAAKELGEAHANDRFVKTKKGLPIEYLFSDDIPADIETIVKKRGDK